MNITSLNGVILWTPPQLDCHHEVNFLPNGNFMTLTHTERFVHTWGDSTLWIGDIILEITPEGIVVWEWDCFDHLSTVDFDSVVLANLPPHEAYDWTHGNSCTFDAADSSIYYSSRNLSRIVKIDYPAGDIV